MARVINYKDLFVWQKSVNLAKEVYLLFPKIENERLKDLMAKTSISIASNIAEGNSRQISKEYRQFLYCALGDISQIDCQLILAKELGFITHEEYTPFEDKVIELRKMLYGLISKLKQRPPRPPFPPRPGMAGPSNSADGEGSSDDSEDAETPTTIDV
ncbi:MAG: four helix bundle protein [Cyanobacteriota bacterium]